MNAERPSSSDHPAEMNDHPKSSIRVPGDPDPRSKADEAPPSDTEYKVCGGDADGHGGSTPERRSARRSSRGSTRRESERMSGEYLEESANATSRQAAPPASADISISISPLDATIPTRGYVDAGAVDLSGNKSWQRQPSGRKLNLGGELELVTDVARGTKRCMHVHQYDTIRDHQGGHEYDTPRGEEYRHKLLGAEERMLPSRGLQEVNAGWLALAHDDGLLPQGRTHISDSITLGQSLEAIKIGLLRYPTITSTQISLCNEPLISDINFQQVSVSAGLDPQARIAHLKVDRYCKISFNPISLLNEPLIPDLAALAAREKARSSDSKSIEVDRYRKQISLFNEPLSSDLIGPAHISDSKSIEVDRCKIPFKETSPNEPLCSDLKLPQVSGPISRAHISESDSKENRYRHRRIPLREISLPNQPLVTNPRDLPRQKRCRTALKRCRVSDKAVQTEPWLGGSGSSEALSFIEVCRERRVADEYAEQVASSPGPNDTLQLVETSVGVIAPDGLGCGGGGGGGGTTASEARTEGIDLPGPAFKWNDGELPRSESSLASNKRMRLRLGLSKRARPPSLHPTRHTGTLRF